MESVIGAATLTSDLQKLNKMILNYHRNVCLAQVMEKTEAGLLRHQNQDPDAAATVRLDDAKLQNHAEPVSPEDAVGNSLKPAVDTAEEQPDEDVALMRCQVNFVCPLTQAEMENPVKNSKCSHHYDLEAILDMIRAKRAKKKKLRCPNVGCGNTDVVEGDLVLDLGMKRMIQANRRQRAAQKEAEEFASLIVL